MSRDPGVEDGVRHEPDLTADLRRNLRHNPVLSTLRPRSAGPRTTLLGLVPALLAVGRRRSLRGRAPRPQLAEDSHDAASLRAARVAVAAARYDQFGDLPGRGRVAGAAVRAAVLVRRQPPVQWLVDLSSDAEVLLLPQARPTSRFRRTG